MSIYTSFLFSINDIIISSDFLLLKVLQKKKKAKWPHGAWAVSKVGSSIYFFTRLSSFFLLIH